MNPWPMVVADLRAMRSVAALVPLLVAVAVASAVAFAAQERALRLGSARAADDIDIVVGAAGSETQLVLSAAFLDLAALNLVEGRVLAALASDPRAAAVAPLAFGDVVGEAPVIGTTAAFASRWWRSGPVEGRLFEREGEVVIGHDVGLAVGAVVTPSHGAPGRAGGPPSEAGRGHDGVAYTVVGRMRRLGSPYDRAVLAPIESVWRIHGLGEGPAGEGRIGPPFGLSPPGVPAIVVKARGVADAYALRQAYRSGATTAVFPAEVLTTLYRRLGDVRDALVAASWLNTTLILSALTLLVTVLTGLRRKRYGILRALGAPAIYVFAVVWIGATLLLAVGCGMGLALGWGGALVVSAVIEARSGLALPFSPAASDAGLALGLFVLGSLFSLLPALLAYRSPIAEALRS